MARRPNSEFIQIVEGELSLASKVLGVIRCRDFSQEPDLHIRKLDKTEVVEPGKISFKFEFGEDLNTEKEYAVRFADEEAPLPIALEENGAGEKLEFGFLAHTIEITPKPK
jgi:hypothetical protein